MSTPFIQLYVGDYLRDTGGLSTEGHGAYILILFAMWNADGWVSVKKLPLFARLTPAKWAKVKDDILPLLIFDDEICSQKRLLDELEKATGKSLKRSEAGKLGQKAKSLKNKNVVEANALAIAEANAQANGLANDKQGLSILHNQKPETIKKEEDTPSLCSGVQGGFSSISESKDEEPEKPKPPELPDIPDFLDRRPKDEKPKRSTKSALPENMPGEFDRTWAVNHWREAAREDLVVQLSAQADQFRDHHAKEASRMADWPAAWRTWTRNAIRMNRAPFVPAGRVSAPSSEDVLAAYNELQAQKVN